MFRKASIKIFVGTAPEHARADRVLKYSIEKHATQPVEISYMKPGRLPVQGGVTGFTFFRFLVPWICGFKGYAIYLDSDMVLQTDISELYDLRSKGKWVRHAHPEGDCVSVIDCSAVRLTPDDINASTKWGLRQQLKGVYDLSLPDAWNTRDTLQGAKLVHYTAMEHQPWLSDSHPDVVAKEHWLNLERECK